jgi:hypothetical protein
MIINDTITGQRFQTISALCGRACLFLQSIYLQSIYLRSIYLSRHKHPLSLPAFTPSSFESLEEDSR